MFEAQVYFSHSLDALFITPLIQPYNAGPLSGSLCSHLHTMAITYTVQQVHTPL